MWVGFLSSSSSHAEWVSDSVVTANRVVSEPLSFGKQ